MATDLYGKPIGGGPRPEFTLNLQQKRQATLLYHWMSLDYLKGLKALIDALIKGADVNLELAKRQGRDDLIANQRWGVRDTAANWSTHVFPALEDFRKATIKDIALRAVEGFEFTGANQCARVISEFSSMWMTEKEEQAFKDQAEKVYHYASYIDYAAGVGGRRHQLHDKFMALRWAENAHLFPHLPRYRVRTDLEAESGKRPKRTGVYVAQDDVFATLQFAWTGNDDGVLGDAETLNEFGRRMASTIGRSRLWVDGRAMAAYGAAAFKRGDFSDLGGFDPGDEGDPDWAPTILSEAGRTTRPCKWYFVEKIEGEFEDKDQDEVSAEITPVSLRIEAGQPCPREGYWFTPARPGSRRSFKHGEVMPASGGDYGTTIWQWDDRQD